MSLLDKSLRDLSQDQRKCLFPDEVQDMKLHKNYSQGNCLLECSLKYAQNKLLNDTNVSPCTPWFDLIWVFIMTYRPHKYTDLYEFFKSH